MGTPDDAISATIDISDVNGAKFDALEAHASQIADSFWMKMVASVSSRPCAPSGSFA